MVIAVNSTPAGARSVLLSTFFARCWLPVIAVIFGLFGVQAHAQTIQYSIGEPTAEEQLSLELINRARADPAAEGILLEEQAQQEVSVFSDVFSFGTNLTMMKNEMAAIDDTQTIARRMPLSFNATLIDVARVHNQNMLDADRQTHFSTSSSKHYWNRMDNSGYVWSQAGENIFAATLNIREGHASFEIDWGSGPGGMQSPRGHRDTIHHAEFREVGIGYMIASGANVGPGLLTQTFGERISRSTIKPYVTGVAIYDADGDSFYDIGEGIEGVTVEVFNLATSQYEDHYAVTSASGGYSVPVDGGAGDYRVEFTVPGGEVESYTVTIQSEWHRQYNPDWERGFNVKADLIMQEDTTPAYTPPAYSGSLQVSEGSTKIVDFPDLPGAIDYEVLVGDAVDTPVEQDAVATAPVTTDKSSSYPLVSVPLNQGDRLAFHLAHPSGSAGHQSMTLERVFVPGSSGVINFDSRLRRSGTAQIAVLQVTPDWGRTWTDVWMHQSNLSYVNDFTPVSVDVSQFEGQPIKFRFLFYLGGGSVEYGSGSARGWHFDDIGFTDMTEVVGGTRTVVPTSEYAFTPASAGSYHIQVRARAGSEYLRYAPASQFETTSSDYAGWVARWESAAGLAAGALADSSADLDGDGLSQLAEYALEAWGLDPTRSDPAVVPGATIDGSLLCVHYTVDTALSDVVVDVQVSSDLSNWFVPGDPGAPVGFVDTADGPLVGTYQARTAAVPFAGHGSLFMRMRIREITP